MNETKVVIAHERTTRDGNTHAPGTVVALPETEAQDLVARGWARVATEDDESPPKATAKATATKRKAPARRAPKSPATAPATAPSEE